MPFRALHLSPQILQAVRDSGYTEPTPIQIAAIPLILAGDDVIGIAQTGTGKTAAFVLPILMKLAESRQTVARHGELTANRREKHNVHRLRALVLAPTRELVVQIEENVRAYAKHVPLRMATVFGGVSERPQIEALRSGVDLVVATPGRLIDLMEQRVANLSGVEFWCWTRPIACSTWDFFRRFGESLRHCRKSVRPSCFPLRSRVKSRH